MGIMLCDELKEVMNVMQVSGERKPSGYYKKTEVDAAIAELKQKLEDAKATAYAESVDAGMRERRLKRALYKACANWADVEVFDRTVGIDDPNVEAHRWALMRNKCLKKAAEYK
jgi:hypothetical protein